MSFYMGAAGGSKRMALNMAQVATFSLVILLAAGNLTVIGALEDLQHHMKRHASPDESLLVLDGSSGQYEPMALVANPDADSSLSSSPSEHENNNNHNNGRQTNRGNRILYACEETQLQIDCQLGESIQLIRANYGRFSIQICNEHGQLDWKVNCMSPASYQIIASSCQAKQSCQLLASNAIFGDACPGTQKYLEVHYQCVPVGQPGNSSLRYPSPPPPATPTTTTTTTTSTPMTPVSTPRRPQAPDAARWPAEQGRPAWIAAAAPSLAGPVCPESVWRNLRWPATQAGLLVQAACPSHAQPVSEREPYAASLQCLASGRWASRVEAAGCQSSWLRNLTRRLEAGDSPLSSLTDINARLLQGGLFGADLLQLSRLARRLVDELAELLSRINEEKQRISFSRDLLQLLVELVSNLAQEQHADAWADLASSRLESERPARLAGQLVQTLEGALLLLAGSLAPDAANYVRLSENVYVTISGLHQQQLQANASRLTLAAESGLLGAKWMGAGDRFTLHLQAPDWPPTAAGELTDSTGGRQEAPLKLVFLMVRGLAGPPTSSLNSNLLGVSIVADPRARPAQPKVELAAPVELLFRHLEAQEGPARCAYWDAAASDWLQDGCKLLQSNRTHSLCACNHLTTFGLLAADATLIGQQPALRWPQSHQVESQLQLQQHQHQVLLPNGKLLHLAQWTDGQLFGRVREEQGADLRLLVRATCLLGGLLLALHLAAGAYNRAQARRLLGAIPRQAPPPLLVASAGQPVGGKPVGELLFEPPAKRADKLALTDRPELPLQLLLRLLGLQLLLVLLVESQSAQHLLEPTGEQWPPVGLLTWAPLLALYYLQLSVSCWLLAQLARLSLSLWLSAAGQREPAGWPSCSSSTGSRPTTSALAGEPTLCYSTSSNSSADRQLHYAGRPNLYGVAAACYQQQQQQQQQQQPVSPSSSFSSADQQAALSRLEQESSRLYGCRPPVKEAADSLASRLSRCWSPVELALVQLVPIAGAGLICWSSLEAAGQLNSALPAGSLANQLACWPLLAELSAPAFALALYALPGIGVALAALSWLLVQRKGAALERRQRRRLLAALAEQRQSGAELANQTHKPPPVANHYRQVVEKNREEKRPSECEWRRTRRAKHLCGWLLALLAFHSAAWMALLAHLQRVLAANSPAASQLVAFALANLATNLLACWSQRRALRRAGQLAGLPRLLRGQRPPAGPQAPKTAAGSHQSLFLISQQARPLPQPTASCHYQQQQQHLYQHLYESSLQQHHRLHLSHSQEAHLDRVAVGQRNPLTLRPSRPACDQLLMHLDANLALKQQQQQLFLCHQQPGEAEGPLVAFQAHERRPLAANSEAPPFSEHYSEQQCAQHLRRSSSSQQQQQQRPRSQNLYDVAHYC